MKHKKKQLSLEEAIVHIRIEEQNRIRDENGSAKELHSKANLIDNAPKPNKRQYNPNQKNKNKNHIAKKKGHCFVCGKLGHFASQCKHKAQKKEDNKNTPKANIAEGEDEIIAAVVVSEVNMVAGNKDWVVDSGATRHICGDKNSFFEYTPVKEGDEVIYLGDSHSTPVLGKGKILLKLTSGKTLSLSNVLHVPEIRYNLISVFVLGKAGVKVFFESDKIVMTKNGVFVGKGYCSGELFKLNVLDVIMNENVSSSAYLVDSSDLWHARLGHVNFSYIKKMRESGLLPKIHLSNDKCEVCVEAKSTKKTCKQILNREAEPLSLIHSDLGDLKQTMIR